MIFAKILENILLILVIILCIPALPFMFLLNKLHQWIHRNDMPMY